MYFFFFKQKTAYEMRISDWSSDVCSSDLGFLVIDDQHGCTGNSAVMLRSERRSFLFGFGDEDIAVVIEPSRNPVPPPELARNAPRLDILHPVEESLFPRLGHDIDSAVATGLHGRLREGFGVDIPLGGQDRKSVGEGKGGSVRLG